MATESNEVASTPMNPALAQDPRWQVLGDNWQRIASWGLWAAFVVGLFHDPWVATRIQKTFDAASGVAKRHWSWWFIALVPFVLIHTGPPIIKFIGLRGTRFVLKTVLRLVVAIGLLACVYDRGTNLWLNSGLIVVTMLVSAIVLMDAPHPRGNRRSFDAPVSLPEEDLLDRKAVTTALVERLVNSKFPRPRVALTGSIGAGKSSVANFVRADLKSAGHLVVSVDPWRCRSVDDSRELLEASIEDALAPKLHWFERTAVLGFLRRTASGIFEQFKWARGIPPVPTSRETALLSKPLYRWR